MERDHIGIDRVRPQLQPLVEADARSVGRVAVGDGTDAGFGRDETAVVDTHGLVARADLEAPSLAPSAAPRLFEPVLPLEHVEDRGDLREDRQSAHVPPHALGQRAPQTVLHVLDVGLELARAREAERIDERAAAWTTTHLSLMRRSHT